MYNTKNKTQKAYAKNKPTLNLVPKNCVCVFPIEIVGGKTLVSNQGIMPNRKYYDKGSFLYWQEVFDGRSALKIQWEDSITLEKPTGKNYYLAKPRIGKYYYGKPISSGTEALEVSEDASFEDFMSIKANQSITIRFEYELTDREYSKWELQEKFRFTLVDNDIYNLYLIPEICEEKLMYIESHQEYYDDLTGESKGCEITFATLGDKIQKSGKAIEQYCAWNAPGEFAVKPKVIWVGGYGTTDWEKQVIISPQELYYPTPVKYLQVEQQGPALTSTIYALGRIQEWVEVTDPETGKVSGYWKIGPSQILLPHQFIVTQPNPLNRSATPTKNFDLFVDEQVSLIIGGEWLKWQHDMSSQPLEHQKNSGMISLGLKTDWISTETGVHKSNPIQANGTRYDYFSTEWYPLAQLLGGSTTLPEFDTTGCIYSSDTIQLKKTDTMIDIMNKNIFIFNQQPIIPLSMAATRPMFLRDIPLIGSIANLFHIGDIHLKHNTTNRVASHLCFFGDADLCAMCANQNGALPTNNETNANKIEFPINFFGTNETQYNRLGVNAVNTTFCFELTDKVSLTLNNITDTYNTLWLAQTKKDPQTWIFDNHRPLLVNSSLKAVSAELGKQEGFVIDAIVVQSIFDGKIRLSCYGPEEEEFLYPIWTATILSNANWENGNMRDWTNLFLLSNWEERYCIQQDRFTWPERPYKPGSGTDVQVDLGMTTEFFLEANKYFQDITDSGWSLSKGRYERQPGSYCERNKAITQTRTIPYSDLGVAEVTDKDTFIAYFKDIMVNTDSSYIKEWYVEGGEEKKVQKDVNLGAKKIGEFYTGTYTYTFNISPLGVSGRNPEIPTPGAWIHTTEGDRSYKYWYFDLYGKIQDGWDFIGTAYQQVVELTITLGDNISITAVDKSRFYTPSNSSGQGDNLFDKKMGLQDRRIGDPRKAFSKTILNYLKFYWRGN